MEVRSLIRFRWFLVRRSIEVLKAGVPINSLSLTASAAQRASRRALRFDIFVFGTFEELLGDAFLELLCLALTAAAGARHAAYSALGIALVFGFHG